jgi:hypothetical protein
MLPLYLRQGRKLMKKKLLLATRPDVRPLALRALADHFELEFCYNMRDAVNALDRGVDGVLCGLHFGEGEFFDFLQHAKANPDTKAIPFFCLHGSEGNLSMPIQRSIEIATQAAGAERYIQISKLRAELGDEKAFEKIRNLINELV